MNVLFSISGLEYGGSEIFLMRLTTELAKKANVFILNTLPGVENEAIRNMASTAVSIHALPNLNIVNTSSILIFFEKRFSIIYRIQKWFLQRFIRKNKIDIVVSFKYHSDAFITSALEKTAIPIVVSTRGCYSVLERMLDIHSQHFPYFIKETQRIFGRVNGLIWLAKENIQFLNRNNVSVPKQQRQIYNGFAEPENAYVHPIIAAIKKNKDTKIIGMVARGDEVKGWEELLEAFVLLQSMTNDNVQLVLVGDGPYLQTLSNKYKSNESIHFCGFLVDSYMCMLGFDIAVLASRLDTMPNTVIEYLFARKAMIVSDVGEISAMLQVDDSSAGLVLTLTNGRLNVTELAGAMLSIIEDPMLKVELEDRTSKALHKFSMEYCANAYMDFFKKVKNESFTH